MANKVLGGKGNCALMENATMMTLTESFVTPVWGEIFRWHVWGFPLHSTPPCSLLPPHPLPPTPPLPLVNTNQPLSLKVILQSSRYIIAHSRSIKRIGLHIMAIRYKLLHARIFYSSLISAKLALNEAFQPCKRGDSPGQEAWISWAGRGRGDYAIEWLSPTNDHFSQLLHNIWWLYSNKAAQ